MTRKKYIHLDAEEFATLKRELDQMKQELQMLKTQQNNTEIHYHYHGYQPYPYYQYYPNWTYPLPYIQTPIVWSTGSGSSNTLQLSPTTTTSVGSGHYV